MVRITKQISTFTQSDIKKLFKTTRLVIDKGNILVRVAPAERPVARLLVVVPKAVGNAPIRNRIRRRLKALFYQDKLYTYRKDCIVLARPGSADLSYEELRTLLHTAVVSTPS